MKQILVMLSMALLVIQLACKRAYAETNDFTQATLNDGEITGIKIQRTDMRPWCKGTTDVITGQLEVIKGLEQCVVIQGIKVSILYGEFNNNDEAHRAVEFYSTNMALHLYQGLWSGAQNKSIGDESWHGNEQTSNAILFRSDRTCVLVNCYAGDNREKWNEAAELLAKHIEQKIKKGSRIIVPHPPTNTAPPSIPQVPPKPLRPVIRYAPK